MKYALLLLLSILLPITILAQNQSQVEHKLKLSGYIDTYASMIMI